MTTDTLPSVEKTHALLAGVLMHYARETGLEIKPEMFSLYVHPDQLRFWRATINSLTMNMLKPMLDDTNFFGFKIIEDTKIEPGHPVLRCTWEVVL